MTHTGSRAKMMKHVFKNNNACNSWCAGVTDMKNVLPPFRPPQAAPSVSAADVIEADIRKHGFTEKTRQRKEAETRLVALKSRPKERDVYLNGWPLDPPHLRHTVVFDGKYPDRVVEGEAGALSDTQLALADSGHRLVDDAARSVGPMI